MTHDDLMRLAFEAGAKPHPNPDCWGIFTISHDDIERFASLILSNLDPRKLMSFQEGFEAGQLSEREECAKWADLVAREIDNTNNTATYIASGIRARGEK